MSWWSLMLPCHDPFVFHPFLLCAITTGIYFNTECILSFGFLLHNTSTISLAERVMSDTLDYEYNFRVDHIYSRELIGRSHYPWGYLSSDLTYLLLLAFYPAAIGKTCAAEKENPLKLEKNPSLMINEWSPQSRPSYFRIMCSSSFLTNSNAGSPKNTALSPFPRCG